MERVNLGPTFIDTSSSVEMGSFPPNDIDTRGLLRPRERYVDKSDKSNSTEVPSDPSNPGEGLPEPDETVMGNTTRTNNTSGTTTTPSSTNTQETPQPQETNTAVLEDKYLESVKTALKNNPNLNDQEKGIALFHYLYPQAKIDPALNSGLNMDNINKAIADAQNAAADVVKQLNSTWTPPKPDPEAFELSYHSAFTKSLHDLNIPADDWGKYEYYFYHPESNDADIDLDVMDKIQANIATLMSSTDMIIPEGFSPSSKAYDELITKDYDATFEQLLSEYGEANNLTTNDLAKLKRLHYSKTPNSVVKELEQRAADATREHYGIPPSGEIKAGEANFNSKIMANFRVESEKLFRAKALDLSDEDAQYLIQAMINYPNFPEGIPEHIQELAKSIVVDASQKIISKYGLDITWRPTGPVLMKGSTAGLEALNTLEDMRDIAQKYADEFPPGPAKMLFLDFLKEIGKQISAFQEMLYNMETTTTQQNTAAGHALLETKDLQRKKAEKAKAELDAKKAEADDKQVTLGKINLSMKILTPIMAAVSVVTIIMSAGTLGPVVVALMLTLTTLSVVDMIGKEFGVNIMEQVMKYTVGSIGVIAEKTFGASGKTLDAINIVGKIVFIACIVVLAALNPGTAGASASILITSTTLIATSNVIGDILKTSGVDERTAIIAGAATGAALQMGATVYVGMKSAGDAMKAANKLSEQLIETNYQLLLAKNALASATNFTEKVAAVGRIISLNVQRAFLAIGNSFANDPKFFTVKLKSFLTVIEGGLEATDTALTVELNNIKQDIVDIKLRKEKRDVELEDAIETIQDMIKSLQSLFDQISEMLSSSGEVQTKKYKIADSLFQG